MPDFGLLQTPNFAQAALGGYTAGRQIGQQQRTDAALQLYAKDPEAGSDALMQVDPERALSLRNVARENRARELASKALGGGGEGQSGAGLSINKEALQDLARLDPKMAMGLQEFALKADAAQLKQVTEHLAVKANAAEALLSLPPGPERLQAFQQMRSTLLAQGFKPEELEQADLSDQMLVRDRLMGMTFEQRLKAEDTRADNERQDRTAASTESDRTARLALARRADGRAAAARSEGHVRFKERDKDRAAIAAGGRGIPTTLDDLDY